MAGLTFSTDGFVQVAVDSTGKKVMMAQGTDALGNTIYIQLAQLVGTAPDDLGQIRSLLTDLLAVNRASLAHLQQLSNLQISEDDFPQP